MSVLTFLSDYGRSDDFVGVCHGVVARIAPGVRVIDVTHDIPRHDVRYGAHVLARSLPYMPAGVHLAVVDPGVGGERRAVGLRCAEEDRLLVGPDNGLLVAAAEAFGGAVEAVDVSRSPLRLEHVSATFHGRDVFAPVAAHLANGAALAGVGEPIAVEELATVELGEATMRDGAVVGRVLAVDHYGNVTLNITHADVAAAGIRLGQAAAVDGHVAQYAQTFGDVAAGALLLYEDAYRTLALAVNRGSAAARLGLAPGRELLLERA